MSPMMNNPARALQAVDVPQPAPDVVPLPPTPHPNPPPGTPTEIPPLEQPPEIIEPPDPGQHVPVQDPMVPDVSDVWVSWHAQDDRAARHAYSAAARGRDRVLH
ncbi:MAG: hypothetical protein LH480_01065 [Rubrivivax sp.]|nr:hypothetical protein [Rubrivivax sp.]